MYNHLYTKMLTLDLVGGLQGHTERCYTKYNGHKNYILQ